MATQIRVLTKNLPEGRPFDFNYDPNFRFSSAKDHMKNVRQYLCSTANRKPIFNLDSLFSTLPHYPRVAYQKLTPLLKKWGRPLFRAETWKDSDFKVDGSNHCKYFSKPLSVKCESTATELVTQESQNLEIEQYAPFLQEARSANKKIQTDYRESETLTDPYAPKYYVKASSSLPEVLELFKLSYGKGLPPGVATVELIEHLRYKRALEASLPDTMAPAEKMKMLRGSSELDRNEWILREKEIQEVRQIRMELWKKMFANREKLLEERKYTKLESIWQKKEPQTESQLYKINSAYNKKMRYLINKRKAFRTTKKMKKDICNQYTNYGSTVYAPRPMDGMLIDRTQRKVKSVYLTSYRGLNELENMLPPISPDPGKIETIPRGFCTKLTRRLDRAVHLVYEALKEEALKGEEPPRVPRLLQKKKKHWVRPPTPSSREFDEEDEIRNTITLLCQKLIRGRTAQVKMLEGCSRRQDLIDEIRTTFTLLKAEVSVKEDKKNQILENQKEQQLEEHKQQQLNEFLSQAEGSTISALLDFLNKELIRLQEERRISALVMLAERQRHLREADEAGLRQLEERRRKEEDEIFKHVIKVHQTTVDTYLEDIILSASERVADEESRKEIQKLANKINNIAFDIEQSRTQLESEEITADLVHSFLLPEVLKSSAREKVLFQQKKYLQAAREHIYGPDLDGKDVFNKGFDEGEIQRKIMILEQEAMKAMKWNTPLQHSEALTNVREQDIKDIVVQDRELYPEDKSYRKYSMIDALQNISAKDIEVLREQSKYIKKSQFKPSFQKFADRSMSFDQK